MLYGIIAAIDRMPISTGALLDALDSASRDSASRDSASRDSVGWDFVSLDIVAMDAACARPRARAPDKPSSTR